MTKDDFCQRFVAHVLKIAGRDADDGGESVRGYAEGAAENYYEIQHQQDGEGPEDCAELDMSFEGWLRVAKQPKVTAALPESTMEQFAREVREGTATFVTPDGKPTGGRQ